MKFFNIWKGESMDIIYGTNSIRQALEANRVKKLLLSDDFKNDEILKLANLNHVEILRVTKKELNALTKGKNSQSCVGYIIPYKIYSLDEILASRPVNSNRIVAVLDELTDPNNLGAIIRSAEIFNVDTIIYKKVNSVSLSPLVAKISSGAINYVKCCEVVNISRAIEKLKNNSFWVYGLDGSAKITIDKVDKSTDICVVIGSEGKGISRLVKENCDQLVKIPQLGHTPCLNASNAAAIAFYELRRK